MKLITSAFCTTRTSGCLCLSVALVSQLYRASVKNQLVLTYDMSPGAVSMTSGEQPVKRAVTGETAGQTDGKNSKPKPM